MILIPFVCSDGQVRLRASWTAVNAGGRHCARERGAWQPVLMAPATPRAGAEFRGTLKQFVEQCCVIEPGSTVGAGAIYRAYERWAVAGGKRSVMKQRNFEARMVLAGVRIELGRPGGGHFWAGLKLKQFPLANPVN